MQGSSSAYGVRRFVQKKNMTQLARDKGKLRQAAIVVSRGRRTPYACCPQYSSEDYENTPAGVGGGQRISRFLSASLILWMCHWWFFLAVLFHTETES